MSNRPQVESEKLNSDGDHKDSTYFKGRLRYPGWMPDVFRKGTFGKAVNLFPEEAILFEKVGNSEVAKPFGPFSGGNLFDDLDYKCAILGKDIGVPSETPNRESFDDFLLAIADAIRSYNRALYFMRRLHFHQFAPKGGMAYSYCSNIHNQCYYITSDNPIRFDIRPEPDSLPDLSVLEGKVEFMRYVSGAEYAWNQAVSKVAKILGKQSGFLFRNTIADMVELNGFIISARIVCDSATAASMEASSAEAKQVGGSSSSHIRISSAFSK